MPFVVEVYPLGPSLLHRLAGMEPLARLNRRLLVHAQHDAVLRRVDVQAAYLKLLPLEFWVLLVREEPHPMLVRLEVQALQNLMHPALLHSSAGSLREVPYCPARSLRPVARRVDDLQHVAMGVPCGSTGPREVSQPVGPSLSESLLPLADSHLFQSARRDDLIVALLLRRHQYHLGPLRMAMLHGRLHHLLKRGPFRVLEDYQSWCPCHAVVQAGTDYLSQSEEHLTVWIASRTSWTMH